MKRRIDHWLDAFEAGAELSIGIIRTLIIVAVMKICFGDLLNPELYD